jgi:hypothetical protein
MGGRDKRDLKHMLGGGWQELVALEALDSCHDCGYRRGAHRRVRAELLRKVTGHAMLGTREDGYPAFLSPLFTQVPRSGILRSPIGPGSLL